ncbi:uncharacterized protein [Heptranchias perlo]|uniref:uncharacterized protein isoform X2 n=1 Tax=Heptranchias perlo TaxID=212740 RepID=UPI003559DD1B
MDPGVWDSDGCTSSDSNDLPDLVSSDEDLKPWFPPIAPPKISYEVLIPKRWCYLRMSVLKRYCHIVKVQLLSPILFGRPHLDERYRNWAAEAELVQYEHCGELQDLDLKTLKIVDLLESAHRALLVYVLKRLLLIQFVHTVGEYLVKCSTLEEAIKVIKQQLIFRDAWKSLTFGNKMQKATALALTGLHYFNLIKKYSLDHNDLFEQFEDQCFQEEEQAKIFHEQWESDMKKQHYEAAVRSLNKAIRVCAFNHLLYEKRSYCYLQMCQYKKAWSDAKRCIVLRPHSIEGHYQFAGALCGKGWYARALKANSLAVQVCQWKGLNVKGLKEQRELIRTEQILSSKEKNIGKWERDDISLKEQSCDSESSTVEEEEEESDESSEDDDDVIPAVEAADVWVKITKDNIHSDQEQNEQTLHLDIPFLSMNFKAGSSESENDSLDRLNQGQESKIMSSDGDTSDSESDSSLKQNQRDVAIPCNSVEPDNLEKAVSAFIARTPSFPSADLGKAASSASTDPGKAASSSTDPGKAASSPPDPGKAASSPSTDPGKAASSPSTDPGKAASSPSTDPGKAASSPSTDSGKAASSPSTDSGKAASSPSTDPGKAASSSSTDPGKAASSPSTDPGEGASSPSTDPGEGASSPSTDPGEGASSPSTDPGEGASSPSTDPGEGASSPSTDPGEGASSPSTDPGEGASSPSTDPGEGASSPSTDPGEGASSPSTDPGEGASSPSTDPGEGASSPSTDPGEGASSPSTDPGEGASSPSTDPGEGASSSPTDPGEGASSSPTDPGEGASSPTDPGEGASSPTDPGEGASSPTDPGEGASSPTDPGEGASSPTGPGEGASSPTGPGEGASSPTGPGEGASSPSTDPAKDMLSPFVSSIEHRSSDESGLMPEGIDQVSRETKQQMFKTKQLQQEQQNKLEVEERFLKCKLKEASEALTASNFRNAQENYLNALKLIKEKKVYNLTTMEYILIEYACGLSFLGNNLIQDILEAERHFMKMLESFKDEDFSHFNCLSYYGLSRVYLKWNRYKEARTTLEKTLTLVESNLVPGLQTWPGTDTVIEETRDGILKEQLKSLLKECLCQPRPDALCHYQFCYTHNNKRDIYRSDPDFKGFVRVHCSHDCRIEYHLYCWKRCKIKELQDKVEKDILGLDCLTPDCMGCIWKVDIFQDSRQKTIESSKSKENKIGQNPSTKQSASSFNSRKIARKKEKKHQSQGKLPPNVHQEQNDVSNKKPDQSDLKDETVGARKKEGKPKKNIGLSNEWMKNDKSGFLEEATPKLDENSFVDSEMADYYQRAPKEEKMQSSNTNTYLDDVLQDKIYSLNLGSYSNRKSKCKTKIYGTSQHKVQEDVTPSADHGLFLHKSQDPEDPVNPPHSATLAEEQSRNHLSEQTQISLPAESLIKRCMLQPSEFKSSKRFRDVNTNDLKQIDSDDSYSESQSLRIIRGPGEHSVTSKNIKTCDAAVLTDPIKPFESKERTFLYLYHEKTHLLQNCEKSQKLYVQLCSDAQREIKIFKEKHEQLVFNEKKLKDELTPAKVQLEAEKEKVHDKRKYQPQELSALQEELKSLKSNLERNKKTIHENDNEIQKIKQELQKGREKWVSDKKKLQKICIKRKENCRESASRLLSAETQIQEWKEYTRLYFLNRLHQEAVENVKFYTTQKARNVNSLEVIAACDMWEKRMKGIQGQITQINAASWSQESGLYSDGASYTSSCNLMPSQYKSEHQNYSANQQTLSPPLGKNVAFAGNSDTLEGGWYQPATRTIGLDAKPSLGTEKDVSMSAAWPPSYSRLPTMQPSSTIDQLDHSQSDLELEFKMFAGQKRSFPDASLQLSSGGLEMPDPSTEAKPFIIPDISLSTLRTSHVSGNLQNHLFETSGATAKSFNKHFNPLQSAHAIIKSNKDVQTLQTQRPLSGTPTASRSQTNDRLPLLAEPRSSYHTVMEQLFFKFPTTSKDVFHSFINKVKEENGGTLSGLSVDDLVRRVSRHVVQGTHLETAYPSPSEPFTFVPTSYENSFYPSLTVLQPDPSPATPDRFSGLMSASADPSGFESLPLGDLLELEGCFDGF